MAFGVCLSLLAIHVPVVLDSSCYGMEQHVEVCKALKVFPVYHLPYFKF